MGLCVEDPLLEVDLLLVGEQQVEVLQSFAEEEGLHHVLRPQVERVPDVPDGRVAVQYFGVLFDALKQVRNLHQEMNLLHISHFNSFL